MFTLSSTFGYFQLDIQYLQSRKIIISILIKQGDESFV